MDRFSRRDFIGAVALGMQGGIASAAVPESIQAKAQGSGAPPLKPLRARIGHEVQGVLTDQMAAYLARYGVEGVGCAADISDPKRIYATVEELQRARELAERHGLTMDIAECALPTTNVDEQAHPAIDLGESPQRDRDIESFQIHIRNVATAGIPCIKYALTILGAIRTGVSPGRGDAEYPTWRLQDAPNLPLTRAGVVTADSFWERITYFLDRVVPVANEYKVRLALHPHDPGVPPAGYRGVQRVLGTVEGMKRFINIQESPYHGLNFCQGTVSEMLQDPGTQIYDVIRYFGSRNKIFNVHFRNIRGHRDSFVETFPDEGDVDFVKAVKVYREFGYDRLLMPDHVAITPGDPSGTLENFAFDFGYFRGLLQSEAHLA
jgi:mannonate dehydratase